MVSVLISAQNDERALARTLTILVQGAVDGLVRDVMVLVDDPSEAMIAVADHAGCQMKSNTELHAALAGLRSDWVFMLEAGAIPEMGWAEAIRTQILGSSGAVHFQRSPRTPRRLWERLTKVERKLALGVLMTKAQALTLMKGEINCEGLAKQAKSKALNATIMPYDANNLA